MTVRLKITLLIVAAGFTAGLVFSSIILLEMMEQPFRLIDADLKTTAGLIVEQLDERPATGTETSLVSYMKREQYWVEVKDSRSGVTLYRSPLAQLVEISWPEPGRAGTIEIALPQTRNNSKHKRVDAESYRIRTISLSFSGREYLVCIGRPIKNLQEEYQDTVVGIIGGLVFSTLVLAAVSYFVAGIILKPIRQINQQVKEISEKQMDRRVPVSGNHDEFDTLARTLNKVFDRLQYAFLQQKHLLADASHELKTPLTLMRLALDDIRSETSIELEDPHGKSHERMTIQVLRMERLVKSLLDLSSLEIETAAKKLPLDLIQILESLISDYQFIGEARGIRIEAEYPKKMAFAGDSEKLTRLFSNLLDNALKYNVDGGNVIVSAESTADGITVIVRNSGHGVPESDVPHLFEQFYRVEKSRSVQHGGSGLGLAIVKRIIELHNGSILFESHSDDWTTVTVFLPL